jgi:hypothetical protein
MTTRLSGIAAMLVLLAAGQVANAQTMVYGQPNGYPAGATMPMAAPGMPGQAMAAPGMACDPCRADTCESSPHWTAFGEFLYLRPRGDDVPFAVPFDGVGGQVPRQLGPVGDVDFEYQAAWRAGVGRSVDECSTITATYTRFQDSASAVTTDAPLHSLVSHPSSGTFDVPWDGAQADHDIRFDLVDIDYRHVFAEGARYTWTYVLGFRYAHLEQKLQSSFVLDDALAEIVDTHVGFDGAGVRVGLEAEHRSACSGLLVYGKGASSFVGGEMRANYLQFANDTLLAGTSWKAGRVVSMFDLEVGLGWQSQNERLRFTVGYMFSGWSNVVRTAEWIHAVQNNDFHTLGNSSDSFVSFDGLVSRAEVRF